MKIITTLSTYTLSGLLCLCAQQAAKPEAPRPTSPPAASPAKKERADFEPARAALAKWVDTQQLISKEKNDWKEGREMLQSRIELVKTEIATLEEKIRQTEGSVKEAEKKKSEFVIQNEALKSAAASLGDAVKGLEASVRQFQKLLPEHVQVKTNPLFQRMPADPANTKVSLAERFQNVLGILNEVNKAHGEITLASEVRSLADGKPAEVKTVYVGLGQAYFLSAKGEAGIGSPSANGWEWRAANELSPDIHEVVEILQNKGTPKFVSLPVKIQ